MLTSEQQKRKHVRAEELRPCEARVCLPERIRAHALSTAPGLVAAAALHMRGSVKETTPGRG